MFQHRGHEVPRTQGDLHVYLAASFDRLDERLRRDLAGVDPAVLGRRPPNRGWTVGEVLEHCCLSNELYLAEMAPLLPSAPIRGQAEPDDRPWRGTLMGRWLARSLEMSMRLPAPRRIRPGPVPRPDVLSALFGTHAQVRELMDRGAQVGWADLRMVSPLSSLVRPNFGEACLIVLRHGERHAGQIERTLAAVG